MKLTWKKGLTKEEKWKLQREREREQVLENKKWRDHFAWLPVRVTPTELAWLETVEKRMVYKEYMYIPSDKYDYIRTDYRRKKKER